MANKRGRPPKIQLENLNQKQIEKLARAGWTNKEIYEFIGVSRSAWENFHEKFPDFAAKLADWKLQADEEVERSLYQRAVGYNHEDVKIMQYEGAPVIVPYTKHYPPDTVAAIFWLKNRRPNVWRDKWDVQHGLDESLARRITNARQRAIEEK